MPTISFEFFPPRTPLAEQRLERSLKPMLDLEPRFATISYGAGGSTQDGTYELVKRLRVAHGIDCGPHLSCVGRTKAQLAEIAHQYLDLGVKRVVALRATNQTAMCRSRASTSLPGSWWLDSRISLTLRSRSVAIPEGHPDDRVHEDRYTYLERKVDAGADLAISQLFFETQNFLAYREECARRRIALARLPGHHAYSRSAPSIWICREVRSGDHCRAASEV